MDGVGFSFNGGQLLFPTGSAAINLTTRLYDASGNPILLDANGAPLNNAYTSFSNIFVGSPIPAKAWQLIGKTGVITDTLLTPTGDGSTATFNFPPVTGHGYEQLGSCFIQAVVPGLLSWNNLLENNGEGGRDAGVGIILYQNP